MRVSMATSAGTAGTPNEDFVGAVPSAVVLLDGAGIPGTESICFHGVGWYTHRLGGALLGRLSRGDGADLPTILGASILETADDHRATCDVADPSSPQATVAMARVRGNRLDYLVIADCFVVLEGVDGVPEMITDEREVAARLECAAPLTGMSEDTPEYADVRAACVEALRARRNRPGGYWIAKDDPQAAQHALVGSLPLREIASVALLSNGASRIVSTYGLTDWRGVLDLVNAHGPAEIIHRVRQAEAHSDGRDSPDADDATVAHCDFRSHPASTGRESATSAPGSTGDGGRQTSESA
jgi:hypothetical protein